MRIQRLALGREIGAERCASEDATWVMFERRNSVPGQDAVT